MEGKMLNFLAICLLLGFGSSNAVSNDSFLAAASRNETHNETPCPEGWAMGPTKTICFKYIGNSQSWNESKNSCRSYHGHLVALTSLAELNFVQDICSKATGSKECWVGSRSTNASNAMDWKWSDDTYNWNGTLVTVKDVD